MQHTRMHSRALSLLLAVAMIVSLFAGLTISASAAETQLNGGETISAGGAYRLAENAKGAITISTTDAVTIIGNGAVWGDDYVITSKSNSVNFNATVAGINLTLQEIGRAHV